LIPHYYNSARVLRVRGADGEQRDVPVNQQYQPTNPKTQQPETDDNGQPVMAMHDLTAGKYDLTVTAGPSYTTRRQETADQMMQLIQSFPQAAPVVGDLFVKNLDWPGADEIAERLKALVPQPQQGLPPQVQQMIAEGKAQIDKLTQENNQLRASQQAAFAKVQQAEMDSQRKAATSQTDNAVKASTAQAQLEIQGYDAETRRIVALASAVTAITPPPITPADAPRT